MALEIIYEELKKDFRVDDNRLFRLLKSGRWKEVIIKANEKDGYCQVGWGGHMFKSHRLLYCLYHQTDVDPNLVIDHINNDKLDNSKANLRLVTARENSNNLKKHRTGRLVGAKFNKRRNKFESGIKINNKQISLGCYNTEQEAHDVYKQVCNMLDKSVEEIQEFFGIRTKSQCSSKYKGVSWQKKNKKWVAQAFIKGKQVKLGLYGTEQEAYNIYLEALTMLDKTVEEIKEHFGVAQFASKYRGVTWHKRDKKWVAQITSDGKQKFLGSFLTQEAANQAVLDFKDSLSQLNKETK